MWALKLFLIVLLVVVLFTVTNTIFNFIFVSKKALEGFHKGLLRYFIPSALISVTISGLCLLVQAPTTVILVAFFTSFIGFVFILLGNDEDNDSFRKL